MNEPAGGGGSRLDAAKLATTDLLRTVPADARVGLRVYGARVAGASRAEACRDSELVIPVGGVDRDEVARTVEALRGKGRTPIGRSLLAAADDLPAGGRRTVILVSDGGDNCAPPDPCKAAAKVSRRGIDMTIQVVGLQVEDRVRDQLRCIADAGGGTYVDAQDPESLRAELAAAFARALRPYGPRGTPVEGGPGPEQAAPVQAGQYLDDLAPGRTRWYAIDVPRGQRLFAAATIVPPPPPEPELSALVDVELRDPQGKTLFRDTSIYRTTGGRAPVGTFAAVLEDPAPATGTYRFGVTVQREAVGFGSALPAEVTFGVGETPDPAAAPQAGPASIPPSARRVQDASDAPLLAGTGLGALLLGLVAGFLAMRRRT